MNFGWVKAGARTSKPEMCPTRSSAQSLSISREARKPDAPVTAIDNGSLLFLRGTAGSVAGGERQRDDGTMSQQPFGDIPLFRELQRILAAGEGGTINFEIARQIAGTIATQTPDPTPSAEAGRALTEGVRGAEVLLSGYTRLELQEPLRSRTMGRATWVLAALDGWRWLLEAVGTRFTEAFTGAGASAPTEANPVGQMMGQVAPLLLGIQSGTVVGHLAADTLARHDPPIPMDDDGALFFVTPNLDRVAAEYDLDLDALYGWISLHEAARQLIVEATPWAARYFRSLLGGLVESIEVDTGDLERRLMDLQSGGAEAVTAGAGMDQLIPIADTERYRRALADLRSFLAVFEGYSEHAVAAVKPQLLGDTGRIDEAMTRRRATPTEGKQMLASILGIERDRALEGAGQTFCAAVVDRKGIPTLNLVWAAPDNLPSLAEIKDPFAWMERVLAE